MYVVVEYGYPNKFCKIRFHEGPLHNKRFEILEAALIQLINGKKVELEPKDIEKFIKSASVTLLSDDGTREFHEELQKLLHI